MKFLWLGLLVAACGPSRPTPAPPAVIPDAAPTAEAATGEMARATELLAGDWAVAGEEVPVVWLHPGGGRNAIYGVAAAVVPVVFVVDDVDDHLEIWRYQGDQVRHCVEGSKDGEGLTFACEEGAGGLRFWRNGDALDVEDWTASSGPDQVHLVEGDGAPAPALEDADRQFDQDTAARGVAGWMAWFAEDAVMWQEETQFKGKAAIEADITKTFDAIVLRWTPTVGRMLVAGGLGVTAGTYTATPHDGTPGRSGTYVTVWRKDPDGWKILIDLGRPDV